MTICVGRQIIRQLAEHGSWVSENGETLVAADDLFHANPLEEIERLRAELFEQDDFILKFTEKSRNSDWACAQCKPGSDMIKDGFICGYHRAEARLTSTEKMERERT